MEVMSKLESQVISKDDLSEKMRDEIGEMRSEMGQVIGKIDSVSKRLHTMGWRALRWRRLDWALRWRRLDWALVASHHA